MSTRPLKLVVGLLTLMIAAACTTTSRGEPAPTSTENSVSATSPSANTDDLPSDGAPKVDNPLDSARFQENPCQALTPAQTQELNLPPDGETVEIALGEGCEWSNTDTRGEVEVGFLGENPRGLSAFYKANDEDKYAYFNELPSIEGFPAIASDIEDRRPIGRCIVGAGVTDQLVVNIVVQLSQANVGQRDPCEAAVQVAGMALETMKGGS